MTSNFSSSAKKVTFSDAKAGDRVWSLIEGWGVVTARFRSHSPYPLNVEFDNCTSRTYTLWGLLHHKDCGPTLFWDVIQIEIPVKPVPALKVDTKVWVWDASYDSKVKRHFSHFENGTLHAFGRGRTSWTGEHTSAWPHWELAE